MYTQTKKKDTDTKKPDSASSSRLLHQKTSHFHSVNRTGIPDSIKEEFERKINIPLDDVRVHYQSSKPDRLHADAYTQGSDVYIAPGKEKYLRHELGHVLQQRMGMVYPTASKINRDAVLEKNADLLANGTMQMPVWNAPYFSMGNAPIQMHPQDVSIREEAEQDVFPIVAKIKALTVQQALLSLEMRETEKALRETEEVLDRGTEEVPDRETEEAERIRLTEEIARIQRKFQELETEIQTLSQPPDLLQAGFYSEARHQFPTVTRGSERIENITSGFTSTLQNIKDARREALVAGIQEAQAAVPFVTSVALSDLLQEMHDVKGKDLSKWDRSILKSDLKREDKMRERDEIHRKYRSHPEAGSPLSLAELEHGTYLQLERDTNAYLSTLSEEEKNALVAYVGGSYEDHNDYLRNAFGKSGKGKLAKTKMNSILSKFPNKTDGFNRLYRAILNYQSIFHGTGHDSVHPAPPVLTNTITVYRGKGYSLLSATNPGENLLELSRGVEKTAEHYFSKAENLLRQNNTFFVEPGVMSTSKNPYVAQEFAKGVILIIRVPAGKSVLAVTGRVQTKGISDSITKFEEEITFPPRSVMRMLSVEREGRNIEIYCQMLP